ncbi:hypothetical protein PGT21_032142 [Puccinia graminis f. sp. tritici]|uniref:Uncharacterized protein n=1 Tax=Puccinia graminis f. sp. tritici TaxID=56615 RepID=A0A5B0NR39_PUCGR|nr:hypothetical protein PGT21_032142 [Puccinia graminis f. sp. tritici]
MCGVAHSLSRQVSTNSAFEFGEYLNFFAIARNFGKANIRGARVSILVAFNTSVIDVCVAESIVVFLSWFYLRFSITGVFIFLWRSLIPTGKPIRFSSTRQVSHSHYSIKTQDSQSHIKINHQDLTRLTLKNINTISSGGFIIQQQVHFSALQSLAQFHLDFNTINSRSRYSKRSSDSNQNQTRL